MHGAYRCQVLLDDGLRAAAPFPEIVLESANKTYILLQARDIRFPDRRNDFLNNRRFA
jgi:hypothetical protein